MKNSYIEGIFYTLTLAGLMTMACSPFAPLAVHPKYDVAYSKEINEGENSSQDNQKLSKLEKDNSGKIFAYMFGGGLIMSMFGGAGLAMTDKK